MTLDGIAYGSGWDIVQTPLRLDILAEAHRRRVRHPIEVRAHSVACGVCLRVWIDKRAKMEKN